MWLMVDDPGKEAPWLMFNTLFLRKNFVRPALRRVKIALTDSLIKLLV